MRLSLYKNNFPSHIGIAMTRSNSEASDNEDAKAPVWDEAVLVLLQIILLHPTQVQDSV